ncbi:hypothetical protein O3P69_004472 [Scylla paramamosain]|uniref:Uncharacterized protein n=1 Tax=Scylla paramamosain TaxID=85552 RepID=A0AAW0UC65_SCYPA
MGWTEPGEMWVMDGVAVVMSEGKSCIQEEETDVDGELCAWRGAAWREEGVDGVESDNDLQVQRRSDERSGSSAGCGVPGRDDGLTMMARDKHKERQETGRKKKSVLPLKRIELVTVASGMRTRST